MASKIVFFILTVLKLNIVWTKVFLPNVHEMMTPEEIYQTFGTHDGSVPYYQVIIVALPETVRRHQGDDEIYLKVEIKDKEINLTFKLTAGYLATKYTPVWLAVTDPAAYNKIRYDPLPNAMTDIGAFKMYQDVDNKAAIVVYDDPDHGTIIEGIVTMDYAIKSLPKRLMNQTLKVGDNHFIESQQLHERSIDPDADEVAGYFALFKTPPSAENTKRNVYRHVDNHQIYSRKRSRPKAVYPEILLVLDHNAIRNHTITQALRFMLALWNGADMAYSTLNNPAVYLNIAGIIISADDAATPYIAENTSINIRTNSRAIVYESAKYFAKELDRFPLIQYDLMIAMTPIILCTKEADKCRILLGASSVLNACTSERQAKRRKIINGVGVVYYNWMFGGVQTVVHESAHLFGVGHDDATGTATFCNYTEGFAMAPTDEFSLQGLKWSACSKRYFRYYFTSMISKCLDNMPIWTKPVKEVLPGRWLTFDGQCQNSGFEKSCQIPEYPVCAINGCKSKKSNECEISEYVPLRGTKCGENKYCETGTGCVDE